MRSSTGAILILLSSFRAFSQAGDFCMGARSMSLAYASGTLADEWSGYNNIGALAGYAQPACACFSYQSLSSLAGFGKKAASLNLPLHAFITTFNFFSFGDEHLNETRIGFGMGHKIRFINLGFQINYFQRVIEQFGTTGMISFDAGGVAELVPGFKLGAGIRNFNPLKISARNGEKLPANMEITFTYNPQEDLFLSLELERNSISKSCIRMGLEYGLHHKLFLRAGIRFDPVTNYYGLGFKPKKFKIDYAFSFQNYLGIDHQLSLSVFLFHKR